MKDKNDTGHKSPGTDDLNRTLERLAVAVETQNAILFEFMRRWDYFQHEPDELLQQSDSSTPEALATAIRDAEFELGYRDIHGRVDPDEREDR